jgi:hypothetical protein
MGTLLVILLIAIIALAIIGLGWSNFLKAIYNGFNKVKNLPFVKNITETSQKEIGTIINNVSVQVILLHNAIA